MAQEGFQGEEGLELSFGGWSLVPFGIIHKKPLFSFPRLLWLAVLRACISSEVGLGRASLSPVGPFSCRSGTRWESLENSGEEKIPGQVEWEIVTELGLQSQAPMPQVSAPSNV